MDAAVRLPDLPRRGTGGAPEVCAWGRRGEGLGQGGRAAWSGLQRATAGTRATKGYSWDQGPYSLQPTHLPEARQGAMRPVDTRGPAVRPHRPRVVRAITPRHDVAPLAEGSNEATQVGRARRGREQCVEGGGAVPGWATDKDIGALGVTGVDVAPRRAARPHRRRDGTLRCAAVGGTAHLRVMEGAAAFGVVSTRRTADDTGVKGLDQGAR